MIPLALLLLLAAPPAPSSALTLVDGRGGPPDGFPVTEAAASNKP